MKKIQTPLLLILTASLLLTACGQEDVAETPDTSAIKNVSLSVAKKDVFAETLPLPGKIAPIVETTLSPQVSGIIKTVNVDAGQTIKAGQVLATLDLSSSTIGTSAKTAETGYSNALSALSLTTESVQKDLESARIQLENAKIARSNTYTTTEKQLQIAQTQLDNIKTTKTNTVTTTSQALKSAQIWVDLAQKWLDNANASIDNFEQNSSKTLSSLYQNIRISIGSSEVSLDAGITQADAILWITEKNRNTVDAFRAYISAKNTTYKNQAETEFNSANQSFTTLKSQSLSDTAALETGLQSTLDSLQKEADLYDTLVTVLTNTIPSSSLPQTQIDAFSLSVGKVQAAILQSQANLTNLSNTLSTTKTSIDTNRVSLKNAQSIAQSQLDNAKQSLANLTANNQSALDTIAGNETLTQTQLENTIAIVNTSRENADNALKIAQAQYDSAKAKLSAQLVGTKSQADAAKGSRDMAATQLANTQIIAPFDGVVLSKNIEIGQLVAPGTPIFTVGNTSSYKIKMDVNADQVSAFSVGKSLAIKKDAQTSTGIISVVAPSADAQTKLFRVEILLDKSATGFLSGDYVDVIVEKKATDEKVIAIPFAALVAFEQGKYGIYTVGSGSTAILRTVTIGAQNATQVEILSGLNEWESYVSNGALSIIDGDKVNVVK